jgi:drug/metabolite transporter (DMT)-like permease
MLVLMMAILGLSFSGPMVRLSRAEPLAIAAWRMGLSLVIIAPFLVVSRGWRQWLGLSRRDLALAIGAGAMLALHLWSWIASVAMTSVAASVVLVDMHPVIVAIGSVLWLKERPTRTQVTGMAIAISGAIVIAVGDASGAASGATAARTSRALGGDALALAGAFTVALYYLAGRRLRRKLDLWAYVGLVYLAGFACLLLMAAAAGTRLAPQPPRELLIFAAIAVGPMMLGHTGLNWALRHLPAYVVSLAMLGEPVGATLLAAIIPAIAERPSLMTLAGGTVILAGVLLTTRGAIAARVSD